MNTQLKLQNIEVFANLVGDQSIVRPGDTSKYFTCSSKGVPDRVYVDGCTSGSSGLFHSYNLNDYVEHAVKGGTSALFLSGTGITKMVDYDRKELMADLCRCIGKEMDGFDHNLSMTYSFIGITDRNVVDFHNDRNISTSKLLYGLDGLQHEVDDWELIESKILKGSTLPFILSLHFESMTETPTNGQFCLVDLNIANWAPTPNTIGNSGHINIDRDEPILGMSSSLTQRLHGSIGSLSNLVHLLANNSVITGTTIQNNPLLRLTGEFLYGDSKTAFILFINTEASARSDLESAIDLIGALRKLKSRELIRAVDRRVLYFFEKARYYQGEKYRFQDELADMQEEKETLERDLDEIQNDFSEERDTLVKEIEYWQGKNKVLDQVIDSLKAENEGIEADTRWEIAKLTTEKLALKDEIRRLEIGASATEDEKYKLIELNNSLQESQASLLSLHEELLNAYRSAKHHLDQLIDDNKALELTVSELNDVSDHQKQNISELIEKIASENQAHESIVNTITATYTQEVGELEDQLSKSNASLEELRAKVTQLVTENKSLAVSQTTEIATLQDTIKNLSCQLEEAQIKAASDINELTERLRTSEKTNRITETENSRLIKKTEQLAAEKEENNEFREQALLWENEREQLQRQVRRLQLTVENSERREAELREESEVQWSSWETEKERNHQKYLKLKEKFRQAVEHAANIQSALDDEREKIPVHAVITESAIPVAQEDIHINMINDTSITERQPPSTRQRHDSRQTSQHDIRKTNMTLEEHNSDKEYLAFGRDTENHQDTRKGPGKSRGRGSRVKRTGPNTKKITNARNYEIEASIPTNTTNSLVRNGTTLEPESIANNTTKQPVSILSASNNSDESDDPEISFNPKASSMHTKSKKLTRSNTSSRKPPTKRYTRNKKSAEELENEVRARPARRKAAVSGRRGIIQTFAEIEAGIEAEAESESESNHDDGYANSNVTNDKSGASSSDTSININSLDVASSKVSNDNSNPSAQRKKKLQEKRKHTQVATTKTSAHNRQSETENGSNDSTEAPTVNNRNVGGIKKKRRLNLSNERSLMGMRSEKQPGEKPQHNPQAVKFTIPKIRLNSNSNTGTQSDSD